MPQQEKNAYILGTEREELRRLGVQHQVWANEARKGWDLAEFGAGQTLLDLGCGPGFCSVEMAYMVGKEGKVIGVDRSEGFINYLAELGKMHDLSLELHACDFDEMKLEEDSLDGAYCRWALAWLPNPKEIIQKVSDALMPGGVFVAQEYYDWSTFQTEPCLPALQIGIKAALKSFKEQAGEIDVGRHLPSLFNECGLEVMEIRPMAKMATPSDFTWQWPKTFLQIYLPKLVASGYLTNEEADAALRDLDALEFMEGATLVCPIMVEVIGVKL